MTFPIDIKEKIDSDFGDKASEAYKILEEATSKTDYLNNSRIIRCIIFLANKDIEKLKKNIAAAYSTHETSCYGLSIKTLKIVQKESGTLIKLLTYLKMTSKSESTQFTARPFRKV